MTCVYSAVLDMSEIALGKENASFFFYQSNRKQPQSVMWTTFNFEIPIYSSFFSEENCEKTDVSKTKRLIC